ncbi:folate-like transporter 2 isoform X3 [Amborella trichopoda]|uniref:folate-like transporter 2 isoform X3 n=1 Tax=Amborella trichopoda TaxID=13333 RepID=UPI0009BDC831|nr:folate-like transporter 2 isoform X3 [Amborella trichopoda]|eukprot:XP_020523888.1 folate-like transporter 2 isoform X3 [Amborella trichopoda]
MISGEERRKFLAFACKIFVQLFLFMPVIYGFGMAARLVFSSYIFLLVPEGDYQHMISITTTTSLLSFMLASELSQLLALVTTSYSVMFILTLSSLGICCLVTFILPKDHTSDYVYPLATFWSQNEGWIAILRETWHGRSLQILSIWWAVAYAGFSLVQNYGTNLFDAIDPQSKFNGHIIAASQVAGSLGSLFAIYLDPIAVNTGLAVYVFGVAAMGTICLAMGLYKDTTAAYCLYILISGIYQALACLVSVRCGRLLTNKRFILMFSVNYFAGLLLETIIQAALEISGLSIFNQFISFGAFFFSTTVAFAILYCVDQESRRGITTSEVGLDCKFQRIEDSQTNLEHKYEN